MLNALLFLKVGLHGISGLHIPKWNIPEAIRSENHSVLFVSPRRLVGLLSVLLAFITQAPVASVF